MISVAEYQRLRSKRTSFQDCYQKFLKKHSLADVGLEPEFARQAPRSEPRPQSRSLSRRRAALLAGHQRGVPAHDENAVARCDAAAASIADECAIAAPVWHGTCSSAANACPPGKRRDALQDYLAGCGQHL